MYSNKKVINILFLFNIFIKIVANNNEMSTNSSNVTQISPQTYQFCTPLCSASVCQRDPYLYDGNGNLKDPGKFGYWRLNNNALYLITTRQLNRYEAVKYCCSFNMNLVNIESENEARFLKELTNLITIWNTGRYFWTSGMSTNCTNNFYWCPNNQIFNNSISSVLPWKSDVPRKYEGQFLFFYFEQFQSPGGKKYYYIVPSDNWEDEFGVICKGSTTTTVVPTVPCKPVCPNDPCNIDNTRFLGDSKTIKDPGKYGFWRQECNSTYLYTNFTMNWLESVDFCCQLGMKLITAENKKKLQCIKNFATSSPSFTQQFWTYATNMKCQKLYLWCGTNKTFSSLTSATMLLNLEAIPGLETHLTNNLGISNTIHFAYDFSKINPGKVNFHAWDAEYLTLFPAICVGPPNITPNSEILRKCKKKDC